MVLLAANAMRALIHGGALVYSLPPRTKPVR